MASELRVCDVAQSLLTFYLPEQSALAERGKMLKVGDRAKHKTTGQLGTVAEIRRGMKLAKRADYGIAWDARHGFVFSANENEVEAAK